MEKKERHHIKKNEVLVLLTKTYDLILKYKKELLYFLLVLVGISLLFWGFISYKNLRERHAGMLFSQALSEDDINYDKLKIVLKKYKNTLAGKEASFLLELKEGKDSKELIKKLDNLIKYEKDPIIIGILIINKIEIYLNEKNYKLASETLQKEKDKLKEDFYLFLNAKIMEFEGRTEEAKTQYLRLFNEFPNSNLRYQAQQRMNVL